ncbi:4-keto-6-deoxy-N-Acetyl-D-hexosaminyl-(Lipid carrier) aminotransferase [Enterococcus mundtii 3F]|uniref:DegT/DnrJ/EryC1/StrS family aminotransferase n=1 Tax=Enterococcus mundtii TaxID=53346 RepID=UPI0023021974|nr:aminotransferase class I/II-fold pyridoxal phosphate-dependent enzyme [Enterococcus mundtii]MDA9461305.1 4-keto-6-deoxy-N-Acetyl-D-hexosaminyl-(Lipid carrier) aminotransferase [Enterococcus mundtii 3F]
MKKKILLSSPHMSDEGYEQAYVKEAFDTNWIAPLGANVDGFESELAEFVQVKYAAALSSGTAAIHLALKAAGVEKGDIVLCQSLTFSATANPIIYQDAIPVFIDSNMESWNMDPQALREGLEKYPHAKAVIVVHLYGLSAELEEIIAICKEYNVTLIEDAAESLGTKYKNQYTGTFGKYGIYSFNGNKIITTSGGGMLVSNEKEKIDKTRFWATQSRDNARHYQHSEIGYNYRMSNVAAGIGRGQLKVLQKRIDKKRYIHDFYKKELGHLSAITFMPEHSWDQPNYWLSAILVDDVDPTKIMDALALENIEARPIWKPMHLQPIFEDFDYIGNRNAENLFNKGICLPSDTKMTDEDILKVCLVIKGVVQDEPIQTDI